MAFLKKKVSPQELGHIIYGVIRSEVMSSNPPMYQIILSRFELNDREMQVVHVVELLIGFLFGAFLAIQKKYDHSITGKIMDGVRERFLEHLKELKLDQSQTSEV